MSQITVGSAVSRVLGSVVHFSLLVVHIGPGILEEGIKRPGWFDTYGFSEFGAREEPPLEQVSFHVVRAKDLDGLSVEPVNEFPQGLIMSLDDGLEGCFGLWVSPRSSERADELVFQILPRGD